MWLGFRALLETPFPAGPEKSAVLKLVAALLEQRKTIHRVPFAWLPLQKAKVGERGGVKRFGHMAELVEGGRG